MPMPTVDHISNVSFKDHFLSAHAASAADPAGFDVIDGKLDADGKDTLDDEERTEVLDFMSELRMPFTVTGIGTGNPQLVDTKIRQTFNID